MYDRPGFTATAPRLEFRWHRCGSQDQGVLNLLILALMVLAVVALLLLGQDPPPFFLLGWAAAADSQHWGQGSNHVDDDPLGLPATREAPALGPGIT